MIKRKKIFPEAAAPAGRKKGGEMKEDFHGQKGLWRQRGLSEEKAQKKAAPEGTALSAQGAL